jgi:four helix bundle protein
LDKAVQSAENTVQKKGGRSAKPAFFNLVAWEKAQALAAELARVVDHLPSSRSASILGSQLLRAGTSVAANIAEGYGRYSEPAYRNHLSIARGSLFETESWLDLLQRSGYISPITTNSLIQGCEEVARLVTATMKPLKSAKQVAIHEEQAIYEAEI